MPGDHEPSALLSISEFNCIDASFINGDVMIHCESYGAGEPLIFLHGFPDNSFTYHKQIAEFSKDYKVYVPTMRGYPPSSVPRDVDRYSLSELVSDIVELLDHLQVSAAHVIGHDWGGVILQAFALYHPERVKSLVLLNSPVLQPFLILLQADGEQQKLARYTQAYHRYQPGDPKDEEHIVRHIRDPEWREYIGDYLRASPIEGMLSYYKKNYPGPPYGNPPPDDSSSFIYKVPTLILWGLDDPYFSIKHLSALWEWFEPSYRFVSIPDAGHWVHQDAPQKVNYEIRSWLAGFTGGHAA
ncbi:alpha/beta fold hydrolase [Rhizobium sp. BE258]|uniref:alpha/beta fold hydrolase n=1 Tax=Rhizobium sp. BE258 TaxID=2817722 RepID=UPI000DD94A16|nr:alpha/beta hydrolase [Rhizobium sp. BE258]MDR7144972.1 pimeloyl-ACP methyl ester carboxylesterase [Rhizobium sp. BE258]